MHVLALILGIAAVVICFVPILNLIFSPVLSAAAIVTGIVSRVLLRAEEKEKERGVAAAGLVLGLVGMGLTLALYGGCAYILKMGMESKEKVKAAVEKEFKEEEINKRIEQMQEDIEKRLDEMEETMEKRLAEIEKGGPTPDPKSRSEEVEKYLEDFARKKEEIKKEIQEWEKWLRQMPILKQNDKTGEGNASAEEEAEGMVLEKEESTAKPAPSKVPPPSKKPKPKPKKKVETVGSPYDYF